MNEKDIKTYEKKGYSLEAKIIKSQELIRHLTSKHLDSRLINARVLIASMIAELIEIREGIPGKTNEITGQILNLIATFIQGFGISENLIFEGQYSKVSAVLKQEYEILTRINELKENDAKEGKNPNVKYAPKGSQKIYGKLNDISHPSNSDIISELLRKYNYAKVNGVSPLPIYDKHYSENLYKSHLFISYEILKELILLLNEIYGDIIIVELEKSKFFDYFKILKQNLLLSDVLNEKKVNH
jgi:hypothetical protein